jgi:hypothetical protein
MHAESAAAASTRCILNMTAPRTPNTCVGAAACGLGPRRRTGQHHHTGSAPPPPLTGRPPLRAGPAAPPPPPAPSGASARPPPRQASLAASSASLGSDWGGVGGATEGALEAPATLSLQVGAQRVWAGRRFSRRGAAGRLLDGLKR